jgi:hypothetical protein
VRVDDLGATRCTLAHTASLRAVVAAGRIAAAAVTLVALPGLVAAMAEIIG